MQWPQVWLQDAKACPTTAGALPKAGTNPVLGVLVLARGLGHGSS